MTFTSPSTLKTLALGLTVSALLGSVASAQEDAAQVVHETASATDVTYDFQNVVFPGDNFVQLLGITHDDRIVGYHGIGGTGHPFQGFQLTLPNTFKAENAPGQPQTQVVAINAVKDTAGFYIDAANVNHGFMYLGGVFKRIDFPGFNFTQLLGFNDLDQAAGYYADGNNIDHAFLFNKKGNIFEVLTIPNSPGGAQATGINNSGALCGFYIDGHMTNHGFLLAQGQFSTLDFPGSTFTQALGLNNLGDVVGVYLDASQLSHGFLLHKGHYTSIDDPAGFGTTVVNGINDHGTIVGFYLDANKATDGLVGTPTNF